MKGLLEVVIGTVRSETLIQHQFDVQAPYLDHYRERLFTATHGVDRSYPVTLEADCFEAETKGSVGELSRSVARGVGEALKAVAGNVPPSKRVATTQSEFVDLVKEVFHSQAVRSLVQSLIARSNEMRELTATAPDASGRDAPGSDRT